MTTRIILDTCIFGKIVEDGIQDEIVEKVNIHKHDLTIYGLKIIRDEIREVPKHPEDKFNLRIALLRLYDAIVMDHILEMKSLVYATARFYYKQYRKNGGSVSWDKIRNDMLIVAEATMSKLDIVVSEDNKTMLSQAAKNAYLTVNK